VFFCLSLFCVFDVSAFWRINMFIILDYHLAVQEFKQMCLQATLECSDSFGWLYVDWQSVPHFWAGHREYPVAKLNSRPWHQEVAVGGRVERSLCRHGGDRDAHVSDVWWCESVCELYGFNFMYEYNKMWH